MNYRFLFSNVVVKKWFWYDFIMKGPFGMMPSFKAHFSWRLIMPPKEPWGFRFVGILHNEMALLFLGTAERDLMFGSI